MDECDLSNLVSVDLIKCIFQKQGCIAAKKPAVTKKHLKSRLSWSLRCELGDTDAPNKILFSDETKMELQSNKREFFGRLPGMQNNPRYTIKTVKFLG